MNNDRDKEAGPTGERDEMAALLPFYLAGKLDAGDRARIEAWLERDPTASTLRREPKKNSSP